MGLLGVEPRALDRLGKPANIAFLPHPSFSFLLFMFWDSVHSLLAEADLALASLLFRLSAQLGPQCRSANTVTRRS